MREHKHGSAASEPGQYPSEVIFITSLHMKPFSSFTLLIFHFSQKKFTFSFFSFFIFCNYAYDLFIPKVEEGSQLIESIRGCSFKEVFYIYL